MESNQNLGISARSGTVLPIHTDLYQITMAYAYFQQGKHNEEAVFECFFRNPPFGGQYVIFGGLREALLFLQQYKWTEEQIDFVRKSFEGDVINPKFFDWLRGLDCSKVRLFAFKEGSIVFAREPLVRIQGPLGLVQMLETSLLNLIGFPSLIATNACQISMRKLVGPNKTLLEFGLRRAQGPDGGLSASQYSYLGGFNSTSNVLCGLRYGIPIAGTMAHSFVTSYESMDELEDEKMIVQGVNIKQKALEYRKSFQLMKTNEGELASFVAYAASFPHQFTALIDTYHTINSGLKKFVFLTQFEGIQNFAIVAMALQDAGCDPKGVRLDSGDLASLSKQIRAILLQYSENTKRDFSKVKIVVSDSINEELLKNFNEQGHSIDVFGIGTHIATCQKQPALGLVYKLVELGGIARMKFSEDTTKATLPGSKRLYRIFVNSSKYAKLDLICNSKEKVDVDQESIIRSLDKRYYKWALIPKQVVQIMFLFWDGKIVKEVADIHEARKFLEEQLETIDPEVMQLKDGKKYDLMISDRFFSRYNTFMHEMCEKIIVEGKII